MTPLPHAAVQAHLASRHPHPPVPLPFAEVGPLTEVAAALAAAVAGRAAAPVDVVVLGDSIVEGVCATSRQARWPLVWQDLLRHAYPVAGVQGGEGWIPATVTSSVTYPLGWSSGGNQAATGAYGLGGRSIAIGPSGWIELAVTGTSVVVAYTRAGWSGTVQVLLDGSVAATVDTAASPPPSGLADDGRIEVEFPARGTHTVRIRHSAGPSVYVGGMWVRDGDEHAGVRVTAAGVSGSSAASWAPSEVPSMAAMAANLTAIDPALMVISLGSIDLLQGRAPGVYRGYMDELVGLCRSAKPGVPILLVAAYEVLASPPTAYPWSAYLEQMQGIALAGSGIALVDLGRSIPDTTELAAAPGGWLGDGLHPSDRGAALIARVVHRALVS